MMGRPGYISATTLLSGLKMSSRRGGGVGETRVVPASKRLPASSLYWTLTAESAAILMSCSRVSSCVVPGGVRQLTLALAHCGSALGAGPAESMVATQVVRRTEL